MIDDSRILDYITNRTWFRLDDPSFIIKPDSLSVYNVMKSYCKDLELLYIPAIERQCVVYKRYGELWRGEPPTKIYAVIKYLVKGDNHDYQPFDWEQLELIILGDTYAHGGKEKFLKYIRAHRNDLEKKKRENFKETIRYLGKSGLKTASRFSVNYKWAGL